jgi:hypothetical protein
MASSNTFFSPSNVAKFACFQEKILGQFAALFFHQAAKIRH